MAIVRRSLHRASLSLMRAAARDAAIYSAHAASAFSPEDAEAFRAVASEAMQLCRNVDGGSGGGSGSRKGGGSPDLAYHQQLQQVWRTRGVAEEPLIFNLVHLFTKVQRRIGTRPVATVQCSAMQCSVQQRRHRQGQCSDGVEVGRERGNQTRLLISSVSACESPPSALCSCLLPVFVFLWFDLI